MAELQELKGQVEKKREASPAFTMEELGEAVQKPQIKFRKALKGHFAKVYALSWCPSEADKHKNLVVSASQDGKLIVWDAISTNKKAAIPLRSSWVMTCAFSPSGTKVACGGLDNVCSIYSLDAKDPKVAVIPPLPSPHTIRLLRRRDGSMFATLS